MDKVFFEVIDGKLCKTVVQEVVFNPMGELTALEAQLSDLKAGVSDTPEDQAEVDATIANYEVAIAELSKL